MAARPYLFRSLWAADASPADVFAVLADVEGYPRWWPEVRGADRLDSQTFRLTVRSLLPYDLAFTTVQTRKDADDGVLEARMSGDLTGFSRWTITADGPGARMVFEEEVVAEKALLRRLAPVARPAFRTNHTLMMRRGRHGLAVYLAGYRRGREL